MKHKYQTQFCACREFRFQHFVQLALDKNFKKSKCLQRAQQLPFSLLIFSALWEGGQWIRKSPGTFRSQTQRDRQTNKTETKTFSQLLLIFIKKLLDRNFHQPSEKFLWHRKQEMLQFSGVFHCHQYHFNQIKSLLYSLCLPMEMDAWMARNCCLLKKSWNEGCRRVFILAGNGLRWNTLDVEQIKEDHWGGTYSCQACNPMAQLLGIYEKLLRSDEAVMRGPWCSCLR